MNNPAISLILPVRNEEKYIGPCLERIFQQTGLKGSLEVLVSDGMSTDRTRQVIRGYQSQHPNLVLIDNPGLIVPAGMNAALRRANGEIIIRVDGHCLIAPDYVSRCVAHLQNDGVDGVGGPMATIGETLLSQAIAAAMRSPFGVGNSAFRTLNGKTLLADTVPFPAYTRQVIQKVGLYDEELVRNQDDEYNYRIREAGGNILLAQDVHSQYYSRGSFAKLWRQYFQYGYWKVRVLQKHPRQMSPRQFVPPLFVLALLGSLLAALLPLLRPFASLVPLAYLLSNLAASLWTAARRGWRNLPWLPFVFAILHLSYGAGFLAGLVAFRHRWRDRVGKVPLASEN